MFLTVLCMVLSRLLFSNKKSSDFSWLYIKLPWSLQPSGMSQPKTRKQDKQWLWLRVGQVHLSTFATVQCALVWFEAHYSNFKQTVDQDRHRNEKVRCATVFSEKLRLRRRTAASSRDEALYRKDLRCSAQQGQHVSSDALATETNEQELEVDVTKVQFSLLSPLSKATDSVQMWSPESSCRPGPESAPLLPLPPPRPPWLRWWFVAPRTGWPSGGDTAWWPAGLSGSDCPGRGHWPCAAEPCLWASTSAGGGKQMEFISVSFVESMEALIHPLICIISAHKWCVSAQEVRVSSE